MGMAEGAAQAGADATGNPTTAASGSLAVPSTGWRRLDRILAAIVGAINGLQREVVTRDFHNRGTGSASGGTGSSSDDLETVTGAVNGVPCTLNVQTDGNGWTEL